MKARFPAGDVGPSSIGSVLFLRFFCPGLLMLLLLLFLSNVAVCNSAIVSPELFSVARKPSAVYVVVAVDYMSVMFIWCVQHEEEPCTSCEGFAITRQRINNATHTTCRRNE